LASNFDFLAAISALCLALFFSITAFLAAAAAFYASTACSSAALNAAA